MTHVAKPNGLLNGGGYDCAIVTSGMDLAAILVRASPSKARSFAVAMHERACAGHDEAALAFWSDVMISLAPSHLSEGASLIEDARASVWDPRTSLVADCG